MGGLGIQFDRTATKLFEVVVTHIPRKAICHGMVLCKGPGKIAFFLFYLVKFQIYMIMIQGDNNVI